MNYLRRGHHEAYDRVDRDTTEAFLTDNKIDDASTLVARRQKFCHGKITGFLILQLFLVSIYTTVFVLLTPKSHGSDDVYCKSILVLAYGLLKILKLTLNLLQRRPRTS